VLNILKTFTLKWRQDVFPKYSGLPARRHSNTCTAFTIFRPLRTTRLLCGLSALSRFVVDLHHCLCSNTKHKSILPTIPKFKIELITRVSKARLKVPVTDALIAHEFQFLLFATHVGAYIVSVEGPMFLQNVRHCNPGNSDNSSYWFLPS
jgi:hypothetical protein